MEKIFNKLVRDKIPQIIKNNNEKPFIRILTDVEYKEELLKKLQEECKEVISATTLTEIKEELADVLEVVSALAILQNSSLDEISNIAKIKKEKRGGFSKRIFLEKTIKD